LDEEKGCENVMWEEQHTIGGWNLQDFILLTPFSFELIVLLFSPFFIGRGGDSLRSGGGG